MEANARYGVNYIPGQVVQFPKQVLPSADSNESLVQFTNGWIEVRPLSEEEPHVPALRPHGRSRMPFLTVYRIILHRENPANRVVTSLSRHQGSHFPRVPDQVHPHNRALELGAYPSSRGPSGYHSHDRPRIAPVNELV